MSAGSPPCIPPVEPPLETHRSALLALARQHGMRSIKMFGSMLRQDARPDSDVDLLVEPAPGLSGFALGALLMDAQALLGRPVDVVTEASLHPALRARVLNEAQGL